MKVILNSDITHLPKLAGPALPRGLAELVTACAARHHEIVLPLTTMLEFERQQTAFAANKSESLAKAMDLLDEWNITHAVVDTYAVVPSYSIDKLLANAGGTVEVVRPTQDDFDDAHRRACLHLAPQFAEEKAPDEMRDLVIWSIAIRLAKADGVALLISADRIHAGSLGADEAASVNLIRRKSIDEALHFFDVETPDAQALLGLLRPAWPNLVAVASWLPAELSVQEVRGTRFVEGIGGPWMARGTVVLKTENGETLSPTPA